MLVRAPDSSRVPSNVATMTDVADTYTGHIEPGTAARRTLPGATIIKTSLGPMDNNAYLVSCSRTGDTLVIDAANDSDQLIGLVNEHAPTVELIVTTHQHGDHWQALEALANATGAPTAAHELDAGPLPVPPARFLADGDAIAVGDLVFDVIHLRGHTPGSVALALRPTEERSATQLFTGDCLFPGGPGRTTKPAEFESLISDLECRVFDVYGDDTHVYPGHGDDTVLGTERPHLKEWRERGW